MSASVIGGSRQRLWGIRAFVGTDARQGWPVGQRRIEQSPHMIASPDAPRPDGRRQSSCRRFCNPPEHDSPLPTTAVMLWRSSRRRSATAISSSGDQAGDMKQATGLRSGGAETFLAPYHECLSSEALQTEIAHLEHFGF